MKTDKNKLCKAIGRRIKDKRIERGLTQSQIAEHLDLSDQYIKQIESGKANLSLNRLIDIAVILDEPVNFLLSGTTEEQTQSQKASYLNSRVKKTRYIKSQLSPERGLARASVRTLTELF